MKIRRYSRAKSDLPAPVGGQSSLSGKVEPPNKPQDLLEHRLLAFSFWTPSDAWNFVHANGKKKETLTLQPFLAMNDYALYILPPGVPPPSPELDKLLKCLDGKVGPVTVTATTNGRHADKGQALGSSVDILPSKGLPADNVFCAAGACGAVRGLNEAPAQGGQKLPTTTGANYHLSLVQLGKHPTTPTAIPDKPECKPGA